MIFESFKVQYLKMVEKYGADKFSKEDAQKVWEEFYDLPESLAVDVFSHVIRTHIPSWPASPSDLINESKKAKDREKHRKEKEAEAVTQTPWSDLNPDAFTKAFRDLGFNNLDEYLLSIRRKKESNLK